MNLVTLILATSILLGNTAPDPRIEKARSILEDNLVDYAGAKVRKAVIVDTGVAVTICADVNSPNRLGGMSGWQKTAIIVEGRDYAPLLQVATNGYSGLSDYRTFCPKVIEDRALAEGKDVSASLQPVARAPRA